MMTAIGAVSEMSGLLFLGWIWVIAGQNRTARSATVACNPIEGGGGECVPLRPGRGWTNQKQIYIYLFFVWPDWVPPMVYGRRRHYRLWERESMHATLLEYEQMEEEEEGPAFVLSATVPRRDDRPVRTASFDYIVGITAVLCWLVALYVVVYSVPVPSRRAWDMAILSNDAELLERNGGRCLWRSLCTEVFTGAGPPPCTRVYTLGLTIDGAYEAAAAAASSTVNTVSMLVTLAVFQLATLLVQWGCTVAGWSPEVGNVVVMIGDYVSTVLCMRVGAVVVGMSTAAALNNGWGWIGMALLACTFVDGRFAVNRPGPPAAALYGLRLFVALLVALAWRPILKMGLFGGSAVFAPVNASWFGPASGVETIPAFVGPAMWVVAVAVLAPFGVYVLDVTRWANPESPVDRAQGRRVWMLMGVMRTLTVGSVGLVTLVTQPMMYNYGVFLKGAAGQMFGRPVAHTTAMVVVIGVVAVGATAAVIGGSRPLRRWVWRRAPCFACVRGPLHTVAAVPAAPPEIRMATTLIE
jgi:hypothetical protein